MSLIFGHWHRYKKRMRQFGKVDIPQEAFIEALKMGD
jgi:translation elongation factor EF-4